MHREFQAGIFSPVAGSVSVGGSKNGLKNREYTPFEMPEHLPDLTPAEREKRFKEIYDTSHLKVHNYIAKIIGDREEALDLLQEVFLLFYDRMPGLDVSTSRIEAWLMRTARNVTMTYVRDTHRRLTRDLLNYEDPITEADGDKRIFKKEIEERLETFLRQLNDQERSIFLLHKIEGVKYEDMRKIFDLSPRTMKRIVASIMSKLRDQNIFVRSDLSED